MSNLLIGIIGVALFIGIALGAAVFLGPRFDEAQTNAQASDVVQAVAQVASSVGSYRLATGYSQGAALSSAQALVDAGYLRDVPTNSTVLAGESSRLPQIVNVSGKDATTSGSASTFQPRLVMMSLGTDVDLCTTVERKLGNIATTSSVSTTAREPDSTLRHSGCFRTSVAATQIAAGDYVVYARV